MQDQENNQAGEQPAEATAETKAAAQAEQTVAQAATEQAATAQTNLEEQLAVAVAKAAEMQDAFLRAKADIENVRRRAQEDISKAHKFAIENFAEAMVPVKDSLEMALSIETPSIEALKEGVDMTLKQLVSAFEKNKLVEILPQAGDKLDPMKHQAISMVPAEQDANTVVTVLQKGYMIADRLLRPALVTVAQ
ncbi:MAG: nucleotide exchange factor GrpE [Burkholderiaceae bacterium]|nr:nucleotide exchange factor GrpE [Burkholderiaceae bacterium]